MKQSTFKSRDDMPMFLTMMDVANLLGISRASAYELVCEDNFPKLKIVQGRTIIPRDRLLEQLDEQTRYDQIQRLNQRVNPSDGNADRSRSLRLFQACTKN